MATIGKLAAVLSLNSKPFTKGMKKTRKDTKKFTAFLGAAFVKAGKVAAIGGAAAAAATTLLTKASFGNIDTTTKLADRLGLATDKLVGLQMAALKTGVGLNVLHLGLQRMTRRISEASLGIGVAVAALDELGLEVQSLNKLSPDKQFAALADAMIKVPVQADRIRLSMALLDSEGVALVNTMAGGSKALLAFQRAAERLGTTFTRQMAAKIELANDALLDMKFVFVALGNEIAFKLAPFVIAIAEKFVDLAVASTAVTKSVAFGFDFMTGEIRLALNVLKQLEAAFFTLKSGATSVLAGIAGSMEFLAEAGAGFLNMIPGVTAKVDPLIGAITKDLSETAIKDIKTAGKALADLANDVPIQKLEARWKKFQLGIENRAVALAKTLKERRSGLTNIPGVGGGAPSFQQIVRGRTVFGARVSRNRIPIVGDPRQTALLESMNDSLRRGLPARAA